MICFILFQLSFIPDWFHNKAYFKPVHFPTANNSILHQPTDQRTEATAHLWMWHQLQTSKESRTKSWSQVSDSVNSQNNLQSRISSCVVSEVSLALPLCWDWQEIHATTGIGESLELPHYPQWPVAHLLEQPRGQLGLGQSHSTEGTFKCYAEEANTNL